jgi:hypothetical protein
MKVGDYHFPGQRVNLLLSQYPALKSLPIPLPYAYVRGIIFSRQMQNGGQSYSGPTYLMGKLGLENGGKKGFKQYFLVAFLYKVPIATQLILIMAITSLIRNRKQIDFWKNEAFLLFPVFLFFIIFSFSNSQLGIRYIIVTFPFIFVLCSRVVINWVNSRIRYRIFVISLLAYLVISNISYFPHYFSYFNELLTDRKLGYTILADSNLDFGQNRFYLKDYLEKHPDVMYLERSSFKRQVDLGLSDERLFDLKKPRAGLLVVEANYLLGISGGTQELKWIRENLKPIDHLAYSYLIFKIKTQDLPQIGKGSEHSGN